MKEMAVTITIIAVWVFSVTVFPFGHTRNVQYVKDGATESAKQAGYKVIGYEGYQFNVTHGGKVWYTLERIPLNGITYHAGFARWFDEIHIYDLTAIDAISPK